MIRPSEFVLVMVDGNLTLEQCGPCISCSACVCLEHSIFFGYETKPAEPSCALFLVGVFLNGDRTCGRF